MAIHTLHCTQIVHAGIDDAWAFFSDPRNLTKITPPTMGFEIITPNLPAKIHAGMMIQYRVRPLLGLPVKWLTEITQVRDGEYFVDEQRAGPYAIWHHEHHFRSIKGGRVEVEDRVTYQLPFQPFGELAHGLLVRPQLQRIFAFRDQAIRDRFGAAI